MSATTATKRRERTGSRYHALARVPAAALARFAQRGGYDGRSVGVLAVFATIGGALVLVFPSLVAVDAGFDPLLFACWAAMALLATRRIDLVRDGTLAIVALFGGFLIESWGTRAGLWRYFDGSRPPAFILPAWPAAALATERVARAMDRVVPRASDRAFRRMYGGSMLAFGALLATWSLRGAAHPLSWIVAACVVVTALSPGVRRDDVVRFVAGSVVGFPLELWGTTRFCWTYWSGETPPFVAVLSHGFATLAFARAATLLLALVRRRAAPRVPTSSW